MAKFLTLISQKQRMDGNTADADKTLLEAVKQVEKIDAIADGNRHIRLSAILAGLAIHPKTIPRLPEKM